MADVIVVGLGAMGSAAAYQLAKRGARVIGIDRFAPPHDQGSSHGDTRITRQAIGEGEHFVPLVLRSHEIWREIEAETGEALFDACGALILSGASSSHPKKAGFLDRTIAAARRFDIPHEVLSAPDIAARFPQFILEGDESGYFEPDAGLLKPEACIAAQLGLARRAGAAIHANEPVAAIEPTGSGVRVTTARGTYEAGRAVVTAGAWSPGLVGAALDGLEIHRQVLTWFEVDRPEEYRPGRFPVFIWMHGAEGEQSYGFPVSEGSHGFKVATEIYEGALPAPEYARRTVDPAEITHIYERHVAGRFHGVRPDCVKAATCLYTMAPDNRFLIDRHPDSDRILLASACSGHGFKHSAAIGEALAELALEGRSRISLSPFALAA